MEARAFSAAWLPVKIATERCNLCCNIISSTQSWIVVISAGKIVTFLDRFTWTDIPCFDPNIPAPTPSDVLEQCIYQVRYEDG